jgi:hypothetical protein
MGAGMGVSALGGGGVGVSRLGVVVAGTGPGGEWGVASLSDMVTARDLLSARADCTSNGRGKVRKNCNFVVNI